MRLTAKKLPISVVIMRHVKDRAFVREYVFTAEDRRVLRILKWPMAVEAVYVGACHA